MRITPLCRAALLLTVALAIVGGPRDTRAQELPPWLRDRGEGVTTSLFGTYVRGGELLVYPFYEYERNTADEYHGSELGFNPDETDYLGTSTLHQGLLFLGYGVTDDLAIELEVAFYENATLEKAADDSTSGLPDRIHETGFGEVETQLRWRMAHESESRPEIYSFVEVAYPFQKDRKLIGIHDWEGAFGFGLVKGFAWGTVTPRASFEYEGAESSLEFGEWAVEYLKRVSDVVRIVTTLEGESDEFQLVGELQLWLSPRAFVKLNSGFGLTEKAPDVAPEVGVMLSF
jgi:hypothetical protein